MFSVKSMERSSSNFYKNLPVSKRIRKPKKSVSNSSETVLISKKLRLRNPKISLQKPFTTKIDLKNFKTQICKPMVKATDYSHIPYLPEYKANLQDLTNPIDLIISLKEKYESYGAVKIIAPENWKTDFSLDMGKKLITVRKQVLQELTIGKSFEQKNDEYTYKEFEEIANLFTTGYEYQKFKETNDKLLKNEREYWYLVCDKNSKKVEVEYAADLSSLKYGSGFGKEIDLIVNKDIENQNFMNLNNLCKAPNSLFQILKRKQDKISGISSPWVYLGMLFASFCWHVEDSYMYSANYMHFGNPKTWYVIPGKEKEKFERVIKRKYKNIFDKKPNILNHIILQMDPLELINNNINVYKTHQKPNEFIFTFPKAYHAGFSHGFNCSEAVNFVTLDWICYLKEAKIEYEKKNYSKKLIFPPEWIIFQNYIQRNEVSLTIGIKRSLKKELVSYILKELEIRKSIKIQLKKFEIKEIPANAHYDKSLCNFCKNYSFFSNIKCENCLKKFCVTHFDKCSCEKKDYSLYLRYSDEELLQFIKIKKEDALF